MVNDMKSDETLEQFTDRVYFEGGEPIEGMRLLEEFRHFPSWVQKWIYEADTFHAKDSTLSLKDAMMKADPPDVPSIDCDSYEYY